MILIVKCFLFHVMLYSGKIFFLLLKILLRHHLRHLRNNSTYVPDSDSETNSIDEITAPLDILPIQEEAQLASPPPVTNPVETPVVVAPLPDTQVISNVPAVQLRQSERPKVLPAYLHDYIVGSATVSPSLPLRSNSPTPQQSSGTNHPLSHYISCDRFSSNHRVISRLLQRLLNHVPLKKPCKQKNGLLR